MPTVEDLLWRISADTEGLRRELDRGARSASKFGRRVDREVDKVSDAFRRLDNVLTKSALKSFAAGIGGVGLVQGVSVLRDYADGWKLAAAAIRNAEGASADLAAMQERLFDLAQQTNSGLFDTIDLYTRLRRATDDLTVSEKQRLRVTEVIAKASQIGGGNSQETAAAMVQLSQALASGRLAGDELRSVLENAPRLARAIADGLGVAVGQLREMGRAGELVSDKVFRALLSQSRVIDREFENIGTTVGRALTRLDNAFIRYVGMVDKTSGASAVLAEAIGNLADNFDRYADDLKVLGASVLGTELTGGLVKATKAIIAKTAATREETRATIEEARAAAAKAAAAEQEAAKELLQRRAREAALRRELAFSAASIDTDQKKAKAQKRLVKARKSVMAAELAAASASQKARTAQAALDSAIASTTVRARLATGAMRGLRGAMAFLGGPVGLAITGLTIGMGLLAARTNDAEVAAESHARALDIYQRTLEKTEGKVTSLTAAEKSLARVNLEQAIAKQRDLIDSRTRQVKGIALVGMGYNGPLGGFSDEVLDLRQKFLAGKIGAEDFYLAIDKLARENPDLTGLRDEIAQALEPILAARRALDDLTKRLDVLNGKRKPESLNPAPKREVGGDVGALPQKKISVPVGGNQKDPFVGRMEAAIRRIRSMRERERAAARGMLDQRLEDAWRVGKTETEILAHEKNRQLQVIRDYVRRGVLTEEEGAKARAAVETVYSDKVKSVRDQQAEEQRRRQQELASDIEGILTDAMSGWEGVKRVAIRALSAIIDKLIEVNSAQNAIGGGGSSGGGLFGMIAGALVNGIFGGISAGIGGGLYGPGGLGPIKTNPGERLAGRLATGGPVLPGKPYLVGEEGPELIVPRLPGTVLTADQTRAALTGDPASVSSGVTVQQTINITTGVQQTVRAEIQSMLPQIKAETVSAVADASRRGGRLAGYIGSGAKR